jgi:hypothetical protein
MYKEGLIGEAVEAAAFITNDEGYDVAVLRRVIANEVQDPAHTLLADDEWQKLVNLVNAAPELLFAAKCALADLEGVMPEFEVSGDREHSGWQTIKELKAAIKKATK